MKTLSLRQLLVSFLVFAVASIACADKIALLNKQQILVESRYGKAIKDRLEKKFGQRRIKVEGLQKSVIEKQKAFARDKDVMAKEEISKRQREITKLQQDFQRNAEDLQQDVQVYQQEEFQGLQLKLEEALKQVAKDNKYDLVLPVEVSQYSTDSVDCTKKVIKALDDKFDKEKTKS